MGFDYFFKCTWPLCQSFTRFPKGERGGGLEKEEEEEGEVMTTWGEEEEEKRGGGDPYQA